MKTGYRIKPYRHKRLKWVVRGKENGKWVRKYFENKGEAATFAQQKNTELLNNGREGAEFPSWLRVMAQDCHEQLQVHGKTIRDSTDHYLAHLNAVSKSCTTRELVLKFLAAKIADGMSKRYIEDLRSRLGRFVSAFGDRIAATVGSGEIDDWMRGLNVAATTRNNFRRVLIVLFNFDKAYTPVNPAEKTRRAKSTDAPIQVVAPDVLATLLAVAEFSVLPFFAIGAFAGLRPAELQRLDWSHVDLESGFIEVTAKNSKTATRRLVKILPNLDAWIRPLAKAGGPVVVRNRRKSIDGARERAGISNWPSNALRHSYASYHLAHFKDAAALALEMGHTNTAMIFQHYREVVKPKDAERYWKILPAAESKKRGASKNSRKSQAEAIEI